MLRKLGLPGGLLVALSQFHQISLSLRSISELSGATSSLCTSVFLGGRGVGAYSKSEIYTPKRDDKHPRPFRIGV